MANGKQLKYNVTFWQLFAIIVIAAVLGGIIYNYAYNNMVMDEVNSISLMSTKETTAPGKRVLPKYAPRAIHK